MADLRDEIGYLCDDNMTLAVSGCGRPPVEAPSKEEVAEAACA